MAIHMTNQKKFITNKYITLLAFLVILCLILFSVTQKLFFTDQARADHWLATTPQYQYRQKITLNSSLIAGTLPNFPVFISFTDANLRSTASGGFVNPNTFDIVFASAGPGHPTTSLPHERTSYNSLTGAITAWVLIPSLSATTNEIYIYYGNTSIISSQSNPAAVWGPTGANYQGVWHLDELDPCSSLPPPGFLDSTDPTPTGRHGTCFNAPTFATGQLNGARNFIGAAAPSDGINIPSLTLNPIFTYEAWVRPASPNGLTDFRTIVDNTLVVPQQRWFGTNGTALWFFDGTGMGSFNFMTLDSFQHVTVVANGTDVQFYRNGGLISGSPPRTFSPITTTFGIGYTPVDTYLDQYFRGRIDEVR
ncbi:MAG: LamG-like jellyroll fold domain-containing protein, partial [Patescibacteria group bacterium]